MRKFVSTEPRNPLGTRKHIAGRPDDINSREEVRPQQFVIGNDGTELELSVESRSFVKWVKDQVRKRQKTISNVTGNREEHSMIWGVFMTVTMESAVFMGKNYPNNFNFIVNTTDLTLKQMFDMSAKLVADTRWDLQFGNDWVRKTLMEIPAVNWWRKNHQSPAAQKSTSFQILCCVLVRYTRIPQSNDAQEDRLGWFTSSLEYRNFDGIECEPMDFEWTIFPGFNTLQLSQDVKSLLLRLGETPENFHRKNFIHVDVQRHLLWIKRQWRRMPVKCHTRFSVCKKFGTGQWSFIGPGSEKKWYCVSEDSPQEAWDNMIERMLLEFVESGCPIFRVTSPLSRGIFKKKEHRKLSIHFADQETIETIFRIIVSANQLSFYLAMTEVCEEYETLHVRTARPVVMGQSI